MVLAERYREKMREMVFALEIFLSLFLLVLAETKARWGGGVVFTFCFSFIILLQESTLH